MRAFIYKGFQKLQGVSEWVLLRQAKLGDREAFGKLYALYLDSIFRFVYFKVNRQKELAEDLTADVFVKAWGKIDQFAIKKDSSFKAWLYMIARNTVIDHIRAYKYHVTLEEYVPDDKANHEEEVLKKLQLEEIYGAVKELTEDQQEVILLKFVNDLSNREIASVLGKHEDAIRALQSRGLKELKRKLTQ